MRVYGTGSDDQNYNSAYGYYVVASSHRDKEGGGCTSTFQSLEGDEDRWVNRI